MTRKMTTKILKDHWGDQSVEVEHSNDWSGIAILRWDDEDEVSGSGEVKIPGFVAEIIVNATAKDEEKELIDALRRWVASNIRVDVNAKIRQEPW